MLQLATAKFSCVTMFEVGGNTLFNLQRLATRNNVALQVAAICCSYYFTLSCWECNIIGQVHTNPFPFEGMLASFSPSSLQQENGVFECCHFGDRFRKALFSMTEYAGLVWRKGLTVSKSKQTTGLACGQGLRNLKIYDANLDDDAIFPFVNCRYHPEQSLPLVATIPCLIECRVTGRHKCHSWQIIHVAPCVFSSCDFLLFMWLFNCDTVWLVIVASMANSFENFTFCFWLPLLSKYFNVPIALRCTPALLAIANYFVDFEEYPWQLFQMH